jgi:hypothetical protein
MKAFTKNMPSIWIYRLVRWAFGAFFIAIGFVYEDAWAAFIFGGLFIVTSFFKPIGCLGGNCSIDTNNRDKR